MSKTKLWTEWEDAVLLRCRPRVSFPDIARDYLQGRTPSACVARYALLISKGYERPRAMPKKSLPPPEPERFSPEEYGSRRLLEAYARYYENHVASRAA